MIRTKVLIPIILIAPILLGPAPDTAVKSHMEGSAILAAEEECIYEVRWSLVKLGTIRVRTHPDLHAEAYIDSYDGLPFVNLHSIASCLMDSSLYCRESRMLEKKDNGWWGLEYHLDSESNSIRVDEFQQTAPNAQPTTRTVKDTIPLKDSAFIDGLSIGIFPRRFVRTSQNVVVPTILYGKLGTTTYNFRREIASVDISALDRPVRAVNVKGYTDARGIFGLSGDYEAWFSDDSIGVPIKAKVKVLLGSVTLELTEWNRNGWNPPTM
jgi:hypothetical protein